MSDFENLQLLLVAKIKANVALAHENVQLLHAVWHHALRTNGIVWTCMICGGESAMHGKREEISHKPECVMYGQDPDLLVELDRLPEPCP